MPAKIKPNRELPKTIKLMCEKSSHLEPDPISIRDLAEGSLKHFLGTGLIAMPDQRSHYVYLYIYIISCGSDNCTNEANDKLQ